MRRLVLSALTLALLIPAGAAQAGGTRDAYGKQATTVADWGHCKNVRRRDSGGAFTLSSLVCDLRGERINILTFTEKKDELAWAQAVCTLFPEQWLLVGVGFTMTARDGNQRAARTARRVYGGLAMECKNIGDD